MSNITPHQPGQMSEWARQFIALWQYSYDRLSVSSYNRIPESSREFMLSEFAERFKSFAAKRDLTAAEVNDIWRDGLARLATKWQKEGLRPIDRAFSYEDLIWIFRTLPAQEESPEAPRLSPATWETLSNEELISDKLPAIIEAFRASGYVPTRRPTGITRLYAALWDDFTDDDRECMTKAARAKWLNYLSGIRPVPAEIRKRSSGEIVKWIEQQQARFIAGTGAVNRAPYTNIDYHPERWLYAEILTEYGKRIPAPKT